MLDDKRKFDQFTILLAEDEGLFSHLSDLLKCSRE